MTELCGDLVKERCRDLVIERKSDGETERRMIVFIKIEGYG